MLLTLCQVSFAGVVAVETGLPEALNEDPPEPPTPALSPALERPVPDKLADVVEVGDRVETDGAEAADPAGDELADPLDEVGGDALAPWLSPDAFEASPRSADASAMAACAAVTSLW